MLCRLGANGIGEQGMREIVLSETGANEIVLLVLTRCMEALCRFLRIAEEKSVNFDPSGVLEP
jgi:hypothetical protein